MKPITDLSGYQAELAQMLLTVNRVCREHGLRYHLAYGTALGAFRDQSLIPWDRDVDIHVRMDEFDEFCTRLRRELPPTLKVEDCQSSPDYELLFPRIGAVGVQHHYLHIDIFPVAGAPSTPVAQVFVIYALKFLNHLFTAKKADFSKRVWWGFRTRLVARLLRLAAMPLTDNAIIRTHRRLITRYPMTPSSPVMIVCGTYGRSDLLPERLFREPHPIAFLGDEFPMPSSPEEYLTHIYGDYRQLPSVEARREEEAFFDEVVLPGLNGDLRRQ